MSFRKTAVFCKFNYLTKEKIDLIEGDALGLDQSFYFMNNDVTPCILPSPYTHAEEVSLQTE